MSAVLTCLVIFVSGCNAPATPPPSPNETITQVSVVDALMIGRYDGVMPMAELSRYGDLGVGTLDHLDGELVILDGRAFQVRGDGTVHDVTGKGSTPFAVVTRFREDGRFDCPPLDSLNALDRRIDEALPGKNAFVAARVDGRFRSITLRSVHRQEPPYRPLSQVAESQSVWTHKDVDGTLVGIRCPAWAGGLNVPGYHWHFLSGDRTIGGHVLDCRLRDGAVRYDLCRDWVVKLDPSPGFDRADLTGDHSAALKRVESSRGGERPAK